MAVPDDRAAPASVIERRSIDYIPDAERHGRLFSQFTLWLGANLQITAIVTGALAVALGGDVYWSLIGLFIGQLIGGGVMALGQNLMSAGVSMGQMQPLGRELFAYGREKAGEDVMGAIVGSIPGLSQFV